MGGGINWESQFSHSVTSDSLQPHGLRHARPPCTSPVPGVCSISCQSSRWCHPTSSSSVVPFASYLQSFPAPGSFPMSQLGVCGCYIHNTVFNIDNQKGPKVEHREPCSIFYNKWEMNLKKNKYMYLYNWITFLKFTQHCKSTIVQYKIKILKIKTWFKKSTSGKNAEIKLLNTRWIFYYCYYYVINPKFKILDFLCT